MTKINSMGTVYLICIAVRLEIETLWAHPFIDMTYTQIKSRHIPWIFFKRKSTTEKDADAEEFFQVPIEALLNVDNVAEYESEKKDCAKIHSDSLICFLNQLQFIRYKERNHSIDINVSTSS